jgi:hypothetical protein
MAEMEDYVGHREKSEGLLRDAEREGRLSREFRERW